MEVCWIEHKGKKILVTDFTGIKLEKGMINLLNSCLPLVEALPKGSTILNFIDLTGCFTTPGFLDAARKFEKEVLTHYDVKRAVLGITGPKEILLKGFNLIVKRKLAPFHSRTDALDYLISDKD